MPSTLMIGYGNPDRQDDGLAYHILYEQARRLARPLPESPEEGFLPSGDEPDLWFVMQLAPEMSDDFSHYERLCFIDAHTGDIPEEILLRPVEESTPASAFTHHLTPAACLALVQSIYHKQPEAVLLSVRGYGFGFSRELSERAGELVAPAADLLEEWLHAKRAG